MAETGQIYQKFLPKLLQTFSDSFSNFQVELPESSGGTFTKRFDANSYLYITKAVDFLTSQRTDPL